MNLTAKKTPIGTIHILWQIKNDKPIIFKVLLPGSLDEKLESAKKGSLTLKNVKIENLALDLCSEFQRKVLLATYNIPTGFVSTYGRIASRLSTSPRSVGRALATNPFPIFVPCHRVVKSDGSLGGYQGGKAMKKRLLKSEGIKFHNNKIDKNRII
ncbi:MAG: MGMT family protein [Methanothermobacter sp.]